MLTIEVFVFGMIIIICVGQNFQYPNFFDIQGYPIEIPLLHKLTHQKSFVIINLTDYFYEQI